MIPRKSAQELPFSLYTTLQPLICFIPVEYIKNVCLLLALRTSLLAHIVSGEDKDEDVSQGQSCKLSVAEM